MVLLPPVATAGVSTDIEVQHLLEQVQEIIARELRCDEDYQALIEVRAQSGIAEFR